MDTMLYKTLKSLNKEKKERLRSAEGKKKRKVKEGDCHLKSLFLYLGMPCFLQFFFEETTPILSDVYVFLSGHSHLTLILKTILKYFC